MKKVANHLDIGSFLSIWAIAGVVFWIALIAMISTPPVHAAQDAEPLMDLVFVIDNSGSMRKNDPNFITPQVVETFVRQLPPMSQVGIVLFDENARLLSPMTGISSDQAEQGLIASLKKIDYRGQRTNTPVGIERAIYELRTNGRPLAEKGIVLITDGIVDTGDPKKDAESTQWLKEDLTTQCKQMGISIFGIALTEAADFSLIQTLALRTGGEYFRTYDASEISSVLAQIQVHMSPEPKPALAPLALLPEPADQPKSQMNQQSPGQQTASQTSMAKGKAVMVTEKSIWMVTVTLVLVMAALIGAAVFFFIQYAKRKEAAAREEGNKLDIPEANLEDLDNIRDLDTTTIRLDKARITVGRSQRNDIVIPQPAISGFHATIEFRNTAFYLEDQRSTNGTQLNGNRVTPHEMIRLKSGDRITFAKFDFKFIMVDQIPFGDTVMLSMTALSDPEAEATVVLDLDGADSKQGLISCLQNHLMQIYGLGPKHKDFVNTYFAHDTLDLIAVSAHDSLKQTKSDGEQHCAPIIKNQSFYVVCSLPASIDKAAEWYGARHNGFTQFIFKWIRSDQYKSAHCDRLCIVTFGQDPATWVSITIVPTHSEANPVEIMSVDFLNEGEKASLALDFDNHGRVL